MNILRKAYDYWNLLPCPHCGNRDFSNHGYRVTDSMDVGVGVGMTMEEEYLCPKCDGVHAYWAYGYIEPPADRRQLWSMNVGSFRYACKRAMLTHWGFTDHYWGKGI